MVVKPGDIFCSATDGSLFSKGINFFQRIRSFDNNSVFSHAGIITSDYGDTLEAVWPCFNNGNISKYEDSLLVGRWTGMTHDKAMKSLRELKRFDGCHYPWWRIIVHAIPFAPKLFPMTIPVCSELVCLFLRGAGMQEFAFCKGIQPDYLADAIHLWDAFEVVYER